jgi:hypothetical protein
MLEFVTAVIAVYTERMRLRNSCVELRIDNHGASKWLKTRNMTHLWGQGWMRLLQSVCKDYNIIIKPVAISGAENLVADALSRYKIPSRQNGVDLSMLRGRERMVCPSPEWREQVWLDKDWDSERDLERDKKGHERTAREEECRDRDRGEDG